MAEGRAVGTDSGGGDVSFPQLLAADAVRDRGTAEGGFGGVADQPVVHAMRYALQGGKRLRGFLVLESRADAGGFPGARHGGGGGGRGAARLFAGA